MECFRTCVYAGSLLLATTPDDCGWLPRLPGNSPGYDGSILSQATPMPHAAPTPSDASWLARAIFQQKRPLIGGIPDCYPLAVTAAPTFIPPMELLAVTRLPEGPEWTYEVKLDGYRAQAIHGARLRLLSRRGNDFSAQFRETTRALA